MMKCRKVLLASAACLLLAGLVLTARDASARKSDDMCQVDRETLLALEEHDFDQDLAGGWRKLAALPGCRAAAADLIKEYREFHQNSSRMLFWHEGQLRAENGQHHQAIALFRQSQIAGQDETGWNLYVEATIAFLSRDRQSVLRMRDKLAQLPKPANFAAVGPDGKPLAIPWPPNLNVVDGLITCFDLTYAEAYAAPCTTPLRFEVP